MQKLVLCFLVFFNRRKKSFNIKTTARTYSNLHTLEKKTGNRIMDIWMKMNGFTVATGQSSCRTASSHPPPRFNVIIKSGEEHKEVLSNIHPFSDGVEIVDRTLRSRSRDALG